MMKKSKILKIAIFSVLFAPLALMAQPEAPVHQITSAWTQYMPLKAINGVATAGDWEVNISYGKEAVIKFIGPRADVSQNGDILFLTGSSASGEKYRADVILPDIKKLNINGQSTAYLTDLFLHDLTVKTSGVATVVGLKTRILNLKLMLAGASQIDFANSRIQNAILQIVGPNKTILNMDKGGTLTGTIEGDTSVIYYGDAKKQDVLVRGGATITQEQQPKSSS